MRFVPWIPAIALGTAGAAALLHGSLVAPGKLRIHRREVHLPRLPRAFNGYRILHVSDVHLGALASGDDHLLAASSVEADLVAVTGDMIEYEQYGEASARLLGTFSSTDGVVCVLGNHDHAATRSIGGVGHLIHALADHGVSTLVNEAMCVTRGNDRLWIVGVDDPYEYRADMGKAFDRVPVEAPVVLLAHSPDVCGILPPGRADLVLTGHCHGGQVRTPFGAILTRTRSNDLPDVLGLKKVGGTLVNMSGGIGSTIPLRILCPPEVTVLHLVASPPRSHPARSVHMGKSRPVGVVLPRASSPSSNQTH